MIILLSQKFFHRLNIVRSLTTFGKFPVQQGKGDGLNEHEGDCDVHTMIIVQLVVSAGYWEIQVTEIAIGSVV